MNGHFKTNIPSTLKLMLFQKIEASHALNSCLAKQHTTHFPEVCIMNFVAILLIINIPHILL